MRPAAEDDANTHALAGVTLPGATPRATSRSRPPLDARELFEMALLVAALLANDLLLPRVMFGDGLERFLALDKLLRTGALTASRYSLIGPIFAAPLWWLGNLNGGVGGAMTEAQRYNPLLFGLGVVALYLILRRRLDGRLTRAFLLILTIASMFPYHLTQFYGEVFTALLVAIGLSAATLSGRTGWRRTGWGLVALGVANTPATLAGLALVTVQRIWASGRLRYLLAPLMAGGLIMGESLLRRGGLFANGYEHDTGGLPPDALLGGWLPGFNYPFFFGLLALLLSFGKGLIFYAPGLFLPLRSRLRALGKSRRPAPAPPHLLAALHRRPHPDLRLLVGLERRLVLGAALLPLRQRSPPPSRSRSGPSAPRRACGSTCWRYSCWRSPSGSVLTAPSLARRIWACAYPPSPSRRTSAASTRPTARSGGRS